MEKKKERFPKLGENLYFAIVESVKNPKKKKQEKRVRFQGGFPDQRCNQPREEPRGVGDVVDVRLVDVDHPLQKPLLFLLKKSLHQEEKRCVFFK